MLPNSDLNEYQTQTSQTAIYPPERAMEYLALGLTSEAGEVAGKVKKVIRDYSGVIDDNAGHAIAQELGDVLWYVAQIASLLNVELADIAAMNIKKLLDRQKNDTIQGSGDDR